MDPMGVPLALKFCLNFNLFWGFLVPSTMHCLLDLADVASVGFCRLNDVEELLIRSDERSSCCDMILLMEEIWLTS